MARGRGRPPKYDWSKWSDGQLYVAEEGKDFQCTLVSFRALVHRTAKENGAKAETQLDTRERKLVFRFLYP